MPSGETIQEHVATLIGNISYIQPKNRGHRNQKHGGTKIVNIIAQKWLISVPKNGYESCIATFDVGNGMKIPRTGLLAPFLGRSAMVIACFGFQLGSMVILVWLSSWNAICVMGSNFLETDHPQFFTVTAGLVGWISGFGGPDPKTAPLCRTFLAPPLWVSTFPQINGAWWVRPVKFHGSAILVYPSLVGSSLVGFFTSTAKHLAHGGLLEAGAEWLGVVFLELAKLSEKIFGIIMMPDHRLTIPNHP